MGKIDIEENITSYIKNNSSNLIFFFFLFVANLFVYGQKLFFHLLATDDYAQLLTEGEERASWVGRWFEGMIYQDILSKTGGSLLYILPYINTLFGIFSFTLAGFLTAQILKQKSKFNIAIVTFLCSTSPFIAHNLYFNLNTLVWFSTLLGVYGLFLAYQSRFLGMIGFVLFVCAIGTYQTIIQVGLAIIMIKTMLDILQTRSKRESWNSIRDGLFFIAFVLVALIVSDSINRVLLKYYYHVDPVQRYATAFEIQNISVHLYRLLEIYAIKIDFLYFKDTFKFTIIVIIFSGVCGLLFYEKKRILLKLVVVIVLFLATPLVTFLPKLFGIYMPLRALYAGNIFIAGLFLFSTVSFRLLKNIGFLASMFFIIISIFYINVFFYSGYRQTSSDIIRANQIVTTIRLHKNYENESKLTLFKIVGRKKFSVPGWFTPQEALNTDWSKYNVFRKFTDFKFQELDDENYKIIENKMIEKGKLIESYPAKSSIFIYNNNIVLFLDTKDINEKIKQAIYH